LVIDVWARVAPRFSGPSPYRKVEDVGRRVSWGRPEIVVSFTNGDVVHTLPETRWEIDMEIDR
jgi:hypothetical protein